MSSHISAINNDHSKAKVMILNIYTFLMLAGVWKLYRKNKIEATLELYCIL